MPTILCEGSGYQEKIRTKTKKKQTKAPKGWVQFLKTNFLKVNYISLLNIDEY